MENLKTYPIVMLPTEKASRIHLANNKLIYCKELFTDGLTGRNQHLYIIVDRKEDDESTWIKEGDWCLFFWGGGQLGSDKPQQYQPSKGHVLNDGLKKIVVTTDTNINEPKTKEKDVAYAMLPQIPESFMQAYIKAYNEGKPITEVNLEMEIDYITNATPPTKPMDSTVYKIKTRPDNTVIIHIKEDRLYTKGEVENYLRKMYYEATGQSTGHPDGFCSKWINNNL